MECNANLLPFKSNRDGPPSHATLTCCNDPKQSRSIEATLRGDRTRGQGAKQGLMLLWWQRHIKSMVEGALPYQHILLNRTTVWLIYSTSLKSAVLFGRKHGLWEKRTQSSTLQSSSGSVSQFDMDRFHVNCATSCTVILEMFHANKAYILNCTILN